MAKKNKETMSFRVEPDVKKEFENVCRKIGITPSESICIYLHKVIARQAIPFPVKLDVGDPASDFESKFPAPRGKPNPRGKPLKKSVTEKEKVFIPKK